MSPLTVVNQTDQDVPVTCDPLRSHGLVTRDPSQKYRLEEKPLSELGTEDKVEGPINDGNIPELPIHRPWPGPYHIKE